MLPLHVFKLSWGKITYTSSNLLRTLPHELTNNLFISLYLLREGSWVRWRSCCSGQCSLSLPAEMRKLGEMTELLQRTVAPGMKLNTARKLGLTTEIIWDQLFYHAKNNFPSSSESNSPLINFPHRECTRQLCTLLQAKIPSQTATTTCCLYIYRKFVI